MLKTSQKILKIDSLKAQKIFFFKTQDNIVLSFLIDNNSFFIKIPEQIFFKFSDGTILFFIKEKCYKSLFTSFLKELDYLFQNKKPRKKILKLNGLGYKINLETTNLNLKLGYSHLINIRIPETISKISIRKKKLVIESFDNITLGNFINSIKSTRPCDVYKGKGFSELGEVKQLKEIKKK
jgi:hypothetical protein